MLRAAVQSCHGCTLYEHATQAVFGEGLVTSRLMQIGEVPGDSEDIAGKPFIGPAAACSTMRSRTRTSRATKRT